MADENKAATATEGEQATHLIIKVRPAYVAVFVTIVSQVKSQDGNEIFFKVKPTTQFRKVMAAYCQRIGSTMESVRFLFDGTRIRCVNFFSLPNVSSCRPEQTPEELGLEENDEIDAMVS